ncbi:solute carrier family 22 member 8-like [Haliotis rufescens]|uniref:solute carrier family 22 member 8-like n=1 Tax=Haliotis rufescens TaxID=6454 RepID=UPI00201ECE6A|nr:solute carrier family 22 member 8-like [Haliotis rufescens]
MPKVHTEVDPLLDALGGRGRYQLLQYFVSKIYAFSAAFQLLNFVYVARSIPHTCGQPSNISDIFTAIDDDTFTINNSNIYYDKCGIRVVANISGDTETKQLPCLYGYNFAEKKELSIISDMEIVCDQAPLKGLGQTLLIVGQGLGAAFLPIFSDRFGRRPIHLLSHVIVMALGVGVAFSPNFTAFLVLRLILGMFQQGIVLTDATIGIEVFPTKHRKLVAFLSNISWSSCHLCLPLVAYLLRDYSWRILQLGCTSVSLVIILQFFFLEESLRWLVANGKPKQIKKLLKRAARISQVDYQHVLDVYASLNTGQEETQKDQGGTTSKEQTESLLTDPVVQTVDDETHSLLDFIKVKRLGLNVAVLWFIWFTDSMTYFGLYFTSDALAGDRFVNVVLLIVVTMPSSVAIYYLVDRIGRKWTCILLHLTTGFGLVGATVVRELMGNTGAGAIISTVFSCFGFFGAFGAFGTLFFYTPEIFPTNIRNVGLGTSSAFSRLGGMLGPFAGLLSEYVTWGPGAVFTCCCLAATAMINLLPETNGKELPQTISDVKAWYETNNGEQKMDAKVKEKAEQKTE